MNTGIDCIAFDVAKIHLPIASLAKERDIDSDKLAKGLGLLKMTLPDFHQDPVVFAANALTKLIESHDIPIHEIARIYVGTESALDSSKPISSFLIDLIEQRFPGTSLANCDAVDFTFACISGVDAMQNCIDFVRLNPDKKAIIVTTDIAKYDLESTGEYTQGAGAMAMLITKNPRIIAFSNQWGVSTKGVFDFFKPNRIISKQEITGSSDNIPWFDILENEIEIHQNQPVFDGQYSNQCYTDRTTEGYFLLKKIRNTTKSLYSTWDKIIMHLPYAFQGRRMLPKIFLLDSDSNVAEELTPELLKEVSKSDEYLDFVTNKLESSEKASSLIGNLYTSSIFMALASALETSLSHQDPISDKKFGFLAYGSGSKAKVFEGTIQKDWKASVSKICLFETLSHSHEIDFATYEKLHKKELKHSILAPKNEWILDKIEDSIPTLKGARYYKWVK